MLIKQSIKCLWGAIFILSLAATPLTAKQKQSSSKCDVATCERSTRDVYDYVIVGAGTAGAALAAKLSDPDPKTGKFKNSVLVLEAGVNLTDDAVVLINNLAEASASPLFFGSKYSKTSQVNRFEDPTLAVAFYSEGRMWGGSSGHNGLQAYRPTPDVLAKWVAITGDARWDYNNLLNNVMIPMEHYTPNGTPANPAQHGFNGPSFITQGASLDTDPYFIAMSAVTGAPLVPDLNDPTYGNVGIGADQNWITPPLGGPNSIRSFTGNSYLTGIESQGIPGIVDEDGNGKGKRKLKIISQAYVDRIVFSKKKKAKRVEYRCTTSKEETRSVKARKEIILSAGCIQDAVILQRSGIGDPALLESLGIPVVFANANVGANIQNHYGPFSEMFGVGLQLPSPFIGSAFIGLPPATDVRNYQMLVEPFGNLVAIVGIYLTPKSLGSVQIVSRDPFVDPLVNLNMYSDGPYTTPGTDAANAVAYYKVINDIATATGSVMVLPSPDDYAAGDEALFGRALAHSTIAFHQAGSCRMSPSSADGVTDGKLRVHGVDGLRVADTSIAPVISNCNTAYMAQMIGLEAARIIQGE